MEDHQLRVSIIIPCYNHAHWLPHAVDSVLGQTYALWEAIIVDDGSTDDTRAVAARYTDSRIRYLYQDNLGLAGARNTGITTAAGQYVAFLDADDEWEPAFLQTCVVRLAQDPALAFVYTFNSHVDPTGQCLPKNGGGFVPSAKLHERLLEGGFFPPCSVVARTQVVRQVGAFDDSLTSVEDWDLWLRITQNHHTACIPEPLARYRVYPGSMSTNAERMHSNRMAVLTKLFGPPDGDPATWSEDKRRGFGCVNRSAALAWLAQGDGDQAVMHLRQAVTIFPDLLARLDTFYELACGDQPKGVRGEAHLLDLQANAAALFAWLDRLMTDAPPPVVALRDVAYANAYLAVAMLADQAGDWPRARGHLWQALRQNPALWRDRAVLRRLVKLMLGKPLVARLRPVTSAGV